MTSADIVRKAKALADTYADKWKDRTDEDTEELVYNCHDKQTLAHVITDVSAWVSSFGHVGIAKYQI